MPESKPSKPVKSVYTWFGGVAMWLPLSFYVWYSLREVICFPVAYLLKSISLSQFGDSISDIRNLGAQVEVVYSIKAGEWALAGKTVEIISQIDLLSYGYGLPMIIAMISATPGSEGKQWIRGVIAMAVIGLIQALGCYVEILMALRFKLPSEFSLRLDLDQWQTDLLALGYQFCNLVLPSLTAIMLFLAFYPTFLMDLVTSSKSNIEID